MCVIFKLLKQVYFIKMSFNGCDKVVLCHNFHPHVCSFMQTPGGTFIPLYFLHFREFLYLEREISLHIILHSAGFCKDSDALCGCVFQGKERFLLCRRVGGWNHCCVFFLSLPECSSKPEECSCSVAAEDSKRAVTRRGAQGLLCKRILIPRRFCHLHTLKSNHVRGKKQTVAWWKRPGCDLSVFAVRILRLSRLLL